MKVRHGFVTNSSSSSFIIMEFSSDRLKEIVQLFNIVTKNYKDIVGLTIKDGIVMLRYETDSYEPDGTLELRLLPRSPRASLNVLLSLLTRGFGYKAKLSIDRIEENNIAFDTDEYKKRNTSISCLMAAEIFENRNQILRELDKAHVLFQARYWGGEHGHGISAGKYTPDVQEKIYNDIMKTLQISKDEITEDVFLEYAANRCSVKSMEYTYNRYSTSKKSNANITYTLEDWGNIE